MPNKHVEECIETSLEALEYCKPLRDYLLSSKLKRKWFGNYSTVKHIPETEIKFSELTPQKLISIDCKDDLLVYIHSTKNDQYFFISFYSLKQEILPLSVYVIGPNYYAAPSSRNMMVKIHNDHLFICCLNYVECLRIPSMAILRARQDIGVSNDLYHVFSLKVYRNDSFY